MVERGGWAVGIVGGDDQLDQPPARGGAPPPPLARELDRLPPVGPEGVDQFEEEELGRAVDERFRQAGQHRPLVDPVGRSTDLVPRRGDQQRADLVVVASHDPEGTAGV